MSELQEVLKAIAAIDKKLDLHITGQNERCKNCTEDVVDLKHTVFGNGREGLKTSFTKLSTRVNVIIAVLTPIALAVLAIVVHWVQKVGS